MGVVCFVCWVFVVCFGFFGWFLGVYFFRVFFSWFNFSSPDYCSCRSSWRSLKGSGKYGAATDVYSHAFLCWVGFLFLSNLSPELLLGKRKYSPDESAVLLTSIIHHVHSLASLKKGKEGRKTAVEGGGEAGYFKKQDWEVIYSKNGL